MSIPEVKLPVPRQVQDCSECGNSYSLDETHFHRDASQPNGFRRVCRSCRSLQRQELRLKAINKQIERIKHEGFETLRKLPATGGSATPHLRELLQLYCQAFGGPAGWMRSMYADYLMEKGGTARQRYHQMGLNLARWATQSGAVKADFSDMDEEDIRRELDESRTRTLKIAHTPEQPSIDHLQRNDQARVG